MSAVPGRLGAGRVPLPLAGVVVGGLAVGLALTRPHLLLLAVGAGIAALAGIWLWNAAPSLTLTLGLALSCVSGEWDTMGLPSVLAPDRVVLAIALLAIMLRGGASRHRPPLLFEPVHWVLLASVVWAAGSGLTSGMLHSNESLAELLERYGIIPFLVFLCAPTAFRTAKDREVLLLGLCALGTYLGITALLETLKLYQLVVPSYIGNPNIGIHFGRARGPFLESATMGFALFACLGACCVALQRWKRPLVRAWLGGTILLCAAGLLFTLTRQVWIGSVFAVIVVAAATPTVRRWFVPVSIGAAVLVVVALIAVPGLSERVSGRAADKRPVWDRLNIDSAAITATEQNPLVGVGWGNWERRTTDFLFQQDAYPLTLASVGLPVHNAFLGYASRLGLIGVLLWGGAFLLGVVQALRRPGPPGLQPWRALTLGVFTLLLVIINFVPGKAFPNLLIWLLAGTLSAPAYWAFWESRRQPVRPVAAPATLPR